MEIKLEGTVKEILPLQEGEGRNGPWKKQSFILETPGQYSRAVCINIWGDRIDKYNVQQGETVVVSVDIESREFNGRWYTDVKAWKLDRKQDDMPQQNIQAHDDSIPPMPPQPSDSSDGNDPFEETEEKDNDLPF